MKIEEILAVKHLSVEFQTSDGKKQVVKDVSLSLRQGEVLLLLESQDVERLYCADQF